MLVPNVVAKVFFSKTAGGWIVSRPAAFTFFVVFLLISLFEMNAEYAFSLSKGYSQKVFKNENYFLFSFLVFLKLFLALSCLVYSIWGRGKKNRKRR